MKKEEYFIDNEYLEDDDLSRFIKEKPKKIEQPFGISVKDEQLIRYFGNFFKEYQNFFKSIFKREYINLEGNCKVTGPDELLVVTREESFRDSSGDLAFFQFFIPATGSSQIIRAGIKRRNTFLRTTRAEFWSYNVTSAPTDPSYTTEEACTFDINRLFSEENFENSLVFSEFICRIDLCWKRDLLNIVIPYKEVFKNYVLSKKGQKIKSLSPIYHASSQEKNKLIGDVIMEADTLLVTYKDNNITKSIKIVLSPIEICKLFSRIFKYSATIPEMRKTLLG